MKVCVLKEGAVYDIRRVVRESVGVEERELREAVTFAREQIEEFSRVFRRETRRTFGFGVRLDAPAPRVRGSKLFSGFWSGVFVYSPQGSRAGGEPIYIIVKPRIKNYHRMLDFIEKTLFSFSDFLLLTYAIPSLSPTFLSIDLIRRILLELQLLLDREPKLFSELMVGDSGELLDFSVCERGVAYNALVMRRRLNTPLAFSLAVAMRNIASALSSCETVLRDLTSVLSDTAGEELLEVIESYTLRIKSFLRSLLSDEFIAYSLYSLEAVDINRVDLEKYWYVAHSSRIIGRSAQWSESFLGKSKQFLLPSTKIYELYVYAVLIDALRNELGGNQVEESGILALQVGSSKLFFNHYPEEFSRIIKKLSGAIPSPDIFYSYDQLGVPIECKYRELNGAKLNLGDAERLLSYLADSSRNEKLKAVVVALSARRNVEETSINGKRVEVLFTEINPEKSNAEHVQHVLSFLAN